jgi:transcriptional regulator of acetoin/glycerol metabolism
VAREGLRSTPAAVGADVDPRQAALQGLPLVEARERWMAVLEATYLRDLLDRHDGNISAAAKTAGVDRKTFHRLVSKHQIR